MVLGRWEVCEAIQFNSWTAVQGWYYRVAWGAFLGLRDDYLAPFDRRGERSPPGNWRIKEFFVRSAEKLDQRVDRRVAELEAGVFRPDPNKEGWGTKRHYEEFIVEALALDRLSARRNPEKNHISTREYARDPVKLFANMYELTDAICHNHWKPETDQWDSDDSDIPYTNEEDLRDWE
ncbi:hypothetical protein C8A01DRAFT_31477 [Parachaetomium inaequale]|uniref:Uncharacterized protein n=1 Tax=Parachaetomium inaequale TaxID=2588326 RepID=A0AAN6PTR8_9PEZI|nr:hypothetical protein C8A01DRAFT_31477 [Parachaetomium inaequale]